jgi:hypothetical protein
VRSDALDVLGASVEVLAPAMLALQSRPAGERDLDQVDAGDGPPMREQPAVAAIS